MRAANKSLMVEKYLQVRYPYRMFSGNARFLRQGLIERYRAMTPEQRIRAFIDHSLRMRRLRDLGKADRAKAREAEGGRWAAWA